MYSTPKQIVPEEPTAAPKSHRSRSTYYFIFSCFTAFVSAYIVYSYQSYTKDLEIYNARPDKLLQNADVSDRWKNEQRNFDYEVDSSEKIMFMKRNRKRLISEAYGDVLEVSVGTGRNMDLYDTRPYDELESVKYGRSTRRMVASLTFNDQSEVMIEAAKKKWIKSQEERVKLDKFRGPVKFVTGDAGIPGVIPRPAGGYDTIVQSMGICSMADPVGFLRLLSQLVRQPDETSRSKLSVNAQDGEDDGRGGKIFLLEHGRASSRWSWINSYLDKSAAMHADRYGCWFNKDIEQVIEESGLIVDKIKRSSFGTVWEIVLRPNPDLKPLPQSNPATEPAKQSGSWRSWLR